MPYLPNRDRVFVDTSKIRDYLLDIEHPVGGSKAKYFMSFGFVAEKWEILHDALLEHANNAQIVDVREKKHGIAYALSGPLITPDTRNPEVLSIWQIDNGEEVPRFITAYPAD